VDRHIVLLRCILLLYEALGLWAQDFEFISLTWGGATGIRTPDLLYATSRQPVHRSASVQAAVLERVRPSGPHRLLYFRAVAVSLAGQAPQMSP
jgi:hypothetical protein